MITSGLSGALRLLAASSSGASERSPNCENFSGIPDMVPGASRVNAIDPLCPEPANFHRDPYRASFTRVRSFSDGNPELPSRFPDA